MPNVNLSTLSGPELRRLLDSARQRGEASLSYRILQEMEARRESGERRGLFAPRRATAEAQTVEIDLGDPLDRDDDLPPMPYWRPPAQIAGAEAEAAPATAPEPEPEPTPAPAPPPQAEPPLVLRVAEPEPMGGEPAADWDLRLPPPRRESPRPPRGLRRGIALGFAAGIASGVGLGWWVWGQTVTAPAAPPAALVQTAAVFPPSSPPPAPAAPVPPPEPKSTPAVEPSPSGDTEVAAAADSQTPDPPPPPAQRDIEVVKPAESHGCDQQPTVADRTICGDVELQRLQRELRQAYNAALEAHEDRALLRQRQLAWASARDPVSDPQRLAQLYEERIRKLNAATAEALRQR